MSFSDNICHGFAENENGGVIYYTIPSFYETGLVLHGFSSRVGGVSEGAFKSLCMSLKREKNYNHFVRNIQLFADAVGVDFNKLTLVNTEHGDNIYSLTSADNGSGITRENTLPGCDALVCTSCDVAALTSHADCVPLFFLDRNKPACCIAHAGWQGVIKKLPLKIVNYFTERFNTRPDDLLVGIGPHIMQCCYTVGEDVCGLFAREFGPDVISFSEGKCHLSMQNAILKQFEQCGVCASNITVADLCTSCFSEKFYSYRREHGNTGAMSATIQLI